MYYFTALLALLPGKVVSQSPARIAACRGRLAADDCSPSWRATKLLAHAMVHTAATGQGVDHKATAHTICDRHTGGRVRHHMKTSENMQRETPFLMQRRMSLTLLYSQMSRLRILCFGDSLTAGFSSGQVPGQPTFHPYRIELERQLLKALPGVKLEIVDDGVPGQCATEDAFTRRMETHLKGMSGHESSDVRFIGLGHRVRRDKVRVRHRFLMTVTWAWVSCQTRYSRP